MKEINKTMLYRKSARHKKLELVLDADICILETSRREARV